MYVENGVNRFCKKIAGQVPKSRFKQFLASKVRKCRNKGRTIKKL